MELRGRVVLIPGSYVRSTNGLLATDVAGSSAQQSNTRILSSEARRRNLRYPQPIVRQRACATGCGSGQGDFAGSFQYRPEAIVIAFRPSRSGARLCSCVRR